jgi:uncharacterized Zn finger protein
MAFDDFAFYGFTDYVSVGSRRASAARELAKLKKAGRTVAPVVIEGRKIARTFWGEAWCDNLERYSDYANRLPRGRTYVRNGSVVDLQLAPGRVTALVSGSTMYEVNVTVEPVPRGRWRAICQDCSGAIDSLIELLQGRLSNGVMTRLCHEKTGLFPAPTDIHFTCSCPDWAFMCKHVAAVLYGIGARLDHQPELLFTLRKINQEDLVARVGTRLSKTRQQPASARVLAADDLSEMFGIDMAQPPTGAPARRKVVPTKHSTAFTTPAAATQTERTRPAKSKKPAPTGERQRLTSKQRQRISDRMRRRWAEWRAQAQTRKATKP